jgi:DNA-directed RNA polymerase alpha subunit
MKRKKKYIRKEKLINIIDETFQFLEKADNTILLEELDEMEILIPGEGCEKLRKFRRNEELNKLTRDKLKSLSSSLKTQIFMDQTFHAERWQSYYKVQKEREFQKNVEEYLREYPDALCDNSSAFNKKLSKRIDEVGLSIRARNCLKNMNINTVADLVQKTEEELLASKNIGRKSLYEVKVALCARGLRFGMAIDSEI